MFRAKESAGLTCMEPPPDVKADIESAVKSAVDAGVKQSSDVAIKSANLDSQAKQEVQAQIKGDLEATRKLLTAALVERSQGLEALRYLLFNACLASIRGDLPQAQYSAFLSNTVPKMATTLIAAEFAAKSVNADGTSRLTGDDLKHYFNFVTVNRP